jgi:hypothetical protein
MNEVSIEEILASLTPEEAITLEKLLMNNLYDRDWCEKHEIDYCSPDIEKAREVTYIKYFKNKKYGR